MDSVVGERSGYKKCVVCGMGKGSRFVYVGTVCRTDGLVGGRSVGRDGGGRSDARAMGWDGTGRGADRFDVAREGSDVGGDGDGPHDGVGYNSGLRCAADGNGSLGRCHRNVWQGQ